MKHLFILLVFLFTVSIYSYGADPVKLEDQPKIAKEKDSEQKAPDKGNEEIKKDGVFFPDLFKDLKYHLKTYYSFANRLDEAITGHAVFSSTAATLDGDLTYKTSGTIGLAAEITHQTWEKFFLGLGVSYDFTRKLDSAAGSVKVVLPTQTLIIPLNDAFTGTRPTIQITTIYGNLYYTINKYVDIGLGPNLGFMSMKTNSPSPNPNTYPSIGYQIGIIGKINNHLSTDLFYRSLTFKGDKTETVNGINLFYTFKWKFNGAQLGIKYTL